jgi:predicted nuclease of predicted toxin-antitoxin system
MKFLADENFPITSIVYLREMGHTVIAVGADFLGITDREVINLANAEECTILTFDSDYGELIFKYGLQPQKGVIYLRLNEFDAVDPGKIIHKIISEADFNTDSTLTVVHEDGIRQRKYNP